MLSVPKLDDLSFEQIFERARSQIPIYTGDWTDFNYHDPGITVLQTFAWLTDTLNYYIDASGEEHRLKYLALLGLKPEQSAAGCNVALACDKKDIVLGRGAKLLAGGTVFEMDESYRGTANKVRAVFQEIDGKFLDLTPLAGVDGEYAGLFTHAPAQQPVLYIGLEHGLESTARFYVDVLFEASRNPFTDDFTLSTLLWEYWDGSSWKPAPLLEDETCGFLRCGFIHFDLDDKTGCLRGHPVLPEAHYLRAKLVRNDYDVLPKLGSIYPNCVRVSQTDTIAQALEYVYDGNPELTVDYHVRENDVVCVGAGDGDGYAIWYEHAGDGDSLCEVLKGAYPWQRVIRFDMEKFGVLPEKGQKILVTVTDADLYDKLHLGVTGGFAREKLAVDINGLYELRLAMVEEKGGRPYFTLWDCCDNILEAAYDARVFQYSRRDGEVILGDGIAGIQPDAGRLVLAVTAKTSLLDGGNVRAGQINRFADETYDGISAHNPADASGGARPKTSDELENEIESKIYATKRAVTPQDYIDIVKATPGLMIGGVNVISGKEYGKFYGGKYNPNTVLLAVRPFSGNGERLVLSEPYRQRIREHIEQYRLLTTEVRILPAKYSGVEVSGKIILTENMPATRGRVEECLLELIDFSHRQEFGGDVVYGRIYSRLEMLDCVTKVSQLSLSCIGEGAHKDDQGNIIVYPDTLAWLRKVDIEFA